MASVSSQVFAFDDAAEYMVDVFHSQMVNYPTPPLTDGLFYKLSLRDSISQITSKREKKTQSIETLRGYVFVN